jgi:hypothetical protein
MSIRLGVSYLGPAAKAQIADGALVVGAENLSALAGDRAYDLCRYGVLQREWIRAGFIELAGPDMLAVGGLDQLGRRRAFHRFASEFGT